MPTERRIYIIEIRPPWIESAVGKRLPDGVRCLYVGETGKAIEERIAEHLTGPQRVAQCFKDARKAKGGTSGKDWRSTPLARGTDVWVRWKMLEKFPPALGSEASEAQEARAIDSLRRQGFIVFPRNAGSLPFNGDHRIWT